jgi:hypothetical protein
VSRPAAATLDEPAHDGAEQRRLVRKAVIKVAVGDPRALRHRLDASGAVAFGEEQLGGDIEDALTEERCRRARRAAAAAWRSRRRLAAAQRP